jgi:hypothetical protein
VGTGMAPVCAVQKLQHNKMQQPIIFFTDLFLERKLRNYRYVDYLNNQHTPMQTPQVDILFLLSLYFKGISTYSFVSYKS